ncbi:MAG: hypothetical protein D3910_25785, partial [Candidatus Electrothrix sp. ATG2]|nr:hypothetical protein [Candidatus Electrothrix sp. ATG2]
MLRVVAILTGIFLAAYTAVHLGYARLEKELLNRSCCGIVKLPPPEPGTQGDQRKRKKLSQSTPKPPPPVEPKVSGTPDAQAVDYNNPDFQVIIRRNIFQLIQKEVPEENTEQQDVEVQAAPEGVPTKLNLILLGTILGDDQTSRAIIIEGNKKEQKLYRIGDAVQGAIIESIERGQVTLEVFGAEETLLMKKREGGGPGMPKLPRRVSSPKPPPDPPDIEDVEEIEEDEPSEIRQFENELLFH